VLGSAIGMDKYRTKLLWAGAGIPTADFALLHDEDDLPKAAALGFPLMIKPSQEGSSIGMAKVENAAELEQAWRAAAEYDRTVLAERWLPGDEFTCAILAAGAAADPAGDAEQLLRLRGQVLRRHHPLSLPLRPAGGARAELQSLCERAFDAVGASGWGRVDFMLDADGAPKLLEVNTVPGMTDHSLVPMAARAAGIDFDELCLRSWPPARRCRGGAGGMTGTQMMHARPRAPIGERCGRPGPPPAALGAGRPAADRRGHHRHADRRRLRRAAVGAAAAADPGRDGRRRDARPVAGVAAADHRRAHRRRHPDPGSRPLKAQVEELPWIATPACSASGRTGWCLHGAEHEAIAQWGDNGLVTEDGIVFRPRDGRLPAGWCASTAPTTWRPRWSSATGAGIRAGRARADHRSVVRNARGDWTLNLLGGTELYLGTDDIETRFERLLAAYPQVEAIGIPTRIDLRYSNGFAVRWVPRAAARPERVAANKLGNGADWHGQT
jgi:hypothetical protein